MASRPIVLCALLCIAACGRTPPLDPDPPGRSDGGGGRDASPRPRDAAMDAPAVPIGCTPSEETCNGRDDDCDGEVDEVAPEVCAGGGTRLCVAGRWSACPRACERCIPGSERVCFISYCTYWGVQNCAADGRGFGPCRERRAPPECLSIARDRRNSPELEQCCVDNAYCCIDEHDLDGDGDLAESLGSCEGILCTP